MKWTSTHSKRITDCFTFIALSLVITLVVSNSYAQTRTYANQVTIGNSSSDHVSNAGNALLTDNSYATVQSSGGTLGIGRYNGQLELKFPTVLPAGTPSFVRIDFNPDILNALIGGNLGGALADVLGGVVLGNHYFKVSAKNGSSVVLSGSSNSAFTNPRIKLIKDAAGAYYLAIAPAAAYDRIYIQDVTDALILGGSNETKVYYAFYGTGTDPCAQGFATGFDGSGLTVDLLGIGKAGVTHMEYAIDNDPDNYSEISLGALGVAGSISQDIYFETLSDPGDEVNIKIQAPSALINAGLLNNVSVTAYNGVQQVGTATFSSLLDLDLLGLLNSGEAVGVPFAPGLPYNRIRITVSSLLNASITQTLNLYAVTRSAGRPVFTAPASNMVTVCSGSAASLTATTNSDNQLLWYAAATGGSPLATLAHDGVYVTPALTATTTYYVAARKIGCTTESVRVPVTVTVTQIPSAPAVSAVAPVCSGSSALLEISSPDAALTYNWYTTANGTTPVFSGASFSTPELTTSTTYYVEAVNGNCVSESRTALTVTVNPLPELPVPSTTVVVVSSGQKATLQASVSDGSTIQWFAAATGGVPLASGPTYVTPALTATTTYYAGSLNDSGCSSPSRVAVTVSVTNGTVNAECNAASAQQTGINGICVLCAIDGAANSTDDDPDNFTRISLSVGVGATGYQRLIFANPGTAADSIRLDLATPVGLADLSVLSGVTVRVMNGNNVVATYALNDALLNLRLLGGNRFTVTLPAAGTFDRVEIRFGALVAALSSLDIYGARIIYPSPTVLAGGETICAGSATTLSAAANGGTTLRWYDAATGGTLLETGESFTTPVLNATTTYYIEVSRGTCAMTSRVPVKVTVTTPPAAPVIAATAPICAGSSALLEVSNPDAGLTYKWYTSATATASIFSGPSFSSPALNANTTYYVEAMNGDCVSASRTAVAVTVNPRPVMPQVMASATTVQPGQTVILTASSADTDVSFNWYTSSAGGSPVYTGATYVTPPLSTTTTFYLESVSNTSGCTSASRAQVTINVTGGGSMNPVPCVAPVSQTNGVTGVALLAGVFNPELAVDDNTTTGSSLVMPVGALGASVYQRLEFNEASHVGDTVRVLISSPGKLLSLGLLANVTVSTRHNNASNNDGLALNSGLIHLELLSGNSSALLSFVPDDPFDAVEIRLNSGVAGALTSIQVLYAQRVLMAPEVASANVTGCETQTVTLSVQNPQPDLVYKWYDASGVYQTGKDGTTFITPALTGDTHYIVKATTASGCASYGTIVNITVTPAPATPVLVSATVNTCAGNDVVLEVKNPLSGLTYKWYDEGGVYQAGKDGPQFVVGAVSGPSTYSVAAVNSCGVTSPARATATIDAGTVDVPVVSSASLTVNSGTPAILTASSGTSGAVFNWYASATSSTILFTGPQYTTDPLINNGSVPLVVTYYVEAVVPGGCPASARAAVDITVLPSGTPTDVPCEPATIAINNGADGIALLSGVFNPGLAVDNNAASGSSFVLPAGLLGGSVYQQVGFTGLSTIGDTVRVRISSPGKLLSLGVLPAIELRTFNGTSSNNDLLIANNPLVSIELLSDNSAATLSFVPQKQFDRVELRLRAGVVSVLTSLDFNYAQRVLVAPKVLSSSVASCEGTSATLTVSNPVAGITYRWYKGMDYLAGKDGVSLNTDPALTAGIYTYYVAAVRNGCESKKTPVTLTINGLPDAPVALAGNPATTCLNTPVVLGVEPVSGVTFNWYDAEADGNLIAANTDTYTTPANLSPGLHTFYVEAVNGNSCSNTGVRTSISITVNPSALASDITVSGNSNPLCSGETATLTASSTTVINPVFTWYTDAALTNAVFTGDVFTTPAITANTTYYVSVGGDNKCPNAATDAKLVTLMVNPPATAADLSVTGADNAFCAGNAATLAASSTTVNNPVFTWYTDAALTNAVYTGASFVTPTLTANTVYYVTVRGSNKCENLAGNAEVVSLMVNPPATASDISVSGAGQPFCAGAMATLTASSTTVINPVFTWYTDAALTNAVYTGAVFQTPALSATTVYYVTVYGTNRCENEAASAHVVTVTINPLPETPVVMTSGTTICSSERTLLSIENPQSGILYQWYDSATGGNLLFTGANFSTAVLNSNTTYYVTAVSASGCGNATGRVQVSVTVSPKPIAPAVVSASVSTCEGSTATLSISNPVAGVSYSWFTTATGGTPVASGEMFTTPVITGSTIYYAEAATLTCTSTSRTAVNVTPTALPDAPVSISGADGPQCSSGTTTLSVDNPDASLTYRWYGQPTGGTVLTEGPSFTTPALTVSATYYVASVNATGCVSSNRTPVTVTILPKLDAPVVFAQTITESSITFKWNDVAGAVGYEVSRDNGLSWTPPTAGSDGTTFLVIGLKPNESVTIRVRALGQLDCQLSDATTFTATADNPLGNTVFIPNTFTPNHDGKNDVFYVYGNTIAKMKLSVYNQWGQFIYQSLDIQSGWDGTYRGELQPNGVYVYYVELEFSDGSRSTRKGTITLLR